jgi:multiple sugar transport system ATP-binding protein
MDAGEIQQVGDPTYVYANPRTMFVADFLGSPSMNFLEGELRCADGSLVVDVGEFDHEVPEEYRTDVESHVGNPIVVGIRPENVSVVEGTAGSDATDASPSTSARADRGYPATVEVVEPQGEKTVLELTVGGQSMNASVDPDVRVRTGDEIGLAFDRSNLHYFDPETGESLTFVEQEAGAADAVVTER